MNHGFVKVASAIPSVRVADCHYNATQIENLIIRAESQGAEVVLFPELSLTAYTCQDLFQQQTLIDSAELALMQLMNTTRSLDIISIVGLPVPYAGTLLNCAAVIQRGRILGLVPKTYLPNYGEFYEHRWFTSVTEVPQGDVWLCGQQVPLRQKTLFRTSGFTFGIELCEDLWAPIAPSSMLALHGADIIFNLSADNDLVGKYAYLKSLVTQQSARLICGYVYSACGFGESTQDLVFDGKAYIAETGQTLAEAKRHCMEAQLIVSEIDVERIRSQRRRNTTFAANAARVRDTQVDMVECPLTVPKELSLTRNVSPIPFVPVESELDEYCSEIFHIQTAGLAKRLSHTGLQKVVIGISGGLDSTLALLVGARTFDLLGLPRTGILGITMPGFGTTDRTHLNAMKLMQQMGITMREISIRDACVQHFNDIAHPIDLHDTTYENSQARERTQILMDVANQEGALVVGTGDLSELALGWATYNGDHMSMYGVNAGVPKTLIQHMVRWVASSLPAGEERATLLDIVDTPISPELTPADAEGNIAQKTEDLVGPYELHDFFLYYTLRWGFRPSKIHYLAMHAFAGEYDSKTITRWLTTFYRRFFSQQFKRSCLPDGPKVLTCSLSPRGDWRMPSDATAKAWIDECERLADEESKN